MSDSKQHLGFSFHFSDTPPPVGARAKTPLANADNLSARGKVFSPIGGKNAHIHESAWLDSPVAPEPMVDPEPPPRATKELVSHAKVSIKSPPIKKIRFPVRNERAQTAAAATATATSAADRTQSPTRFSKSISAAELRVHLDSEPEMARPEDMPDVEQDYMPPPEAGVGWTTDTPHAREIWRRARTTWKTASEKATSLSAQGMRASKALAESVGEKMREKMHSKRMQSDAEQKENCIDPHASSPTSHDLSETASSKQSTGPSVASRVILGLARGAVRKAAAPLSAALAACVVYMAGSYLFGSTDTIALSQATTSPEIPALGTLHAEGNPSTGISSGSDASTVGTKEAKKPVSQGPPVMETEITDMPQGLSWPGKGLIEVVTSAEELVYVDGVFTGRGPLRRIPVSPGAHEISIRADGKERTGKAHVVAGRATRAVFKAE